MSKKNTLKYLFIALVVILSFHFLLTYFKPTVRNPWDALTENHYNGNDNNSNVNNDEEKNNNKIDGIETRTITKSVVETKFLTVTTTETIGDTVQPTPPLVQEKEKPTRKANAAFIILARNGDLRNFRQTMVQLEQRFNRKYQYPYVFLNDVEFTDEFKNHTRSLTKAKCEYGLIPNKYWSVPSHINTTLMDDSMKQMSKEGVIYGGSLNYRHMCRFESGFFYRHELTEKYDYYWRVEPGVDFYCDVDFDPFLYMQDNDIKYGFTISLYEYPRTIETLWSTVKEFKDRYPQYIEEDNWMDFISQDGGATYNLCHFWSNFEIGDLRLWRGEAYSKFFDFLDQKGGFFYERWGDAPVHSIAAALFLKKHQVHFFDEIGYKHPPFMHCPTNENFREKCSCDPHRTFDDETYSCTRKWKNLIEQYNVNVPPKH